SAIEIAARGFANMSLRDAQPAGRVSWPQAPGGDFNRRTEADLLAWLAAHGAAVTQTKREAGRSVYVLEACPFQPGHQRKASVTLYDDGALGFKCLASSCAERHWRDLRDLWQDGPRAQAAPAEART